MYWPGASVMAGSLKTGFPGPLVEVPWGGRSLAGERGVTQALNLTGEGEKMMVWICD